MMKYSNKICILEVDVEYREDLHNLLSHLPFLSERTEIKKCNKFVFKLINKKEYVVDIRALKQALNHGLILKKVHRVIHFNQEALLKPYIEMTTKLTTGEKNDFEKDFFKSIDNSTFGKTIENVTKHRDIKLLITDKS